MPLSSRPKNIQRLILIGAVVVLSACSTLRTPPTGPERLALVDQLVAEQEFARARQLLESIDPSDAEYEALMLRGNAIEPLIVQFEEDTTARVEQLKATDDWQAAQTLLEEGLEKLPNSEALRNAETRFYADRSARLEQINRQISLLRAEHLASKSPLLAQAAAVDPGSWKVRWDARQHGREAESLAADLAECGAQALDESRYELAESCLQMAAALTEKETLTARIAKLDEQRQNEEARAVARAKAEQQAAQAARRAREAEHINALKARFQRLYDAGWWVTAKQVLSELRSHAPNDEDVLAWSRKLHEAVGQRVADAIEEGQSLYSDGQLHRALAVWRQAAELDPENAVLQAHIERVERFIAKLERLDKDA